MLETDFKSAATILDNPLTEEFISTFNSGNSSEKRNTNTILLITNRIFKKTFFRLD